MWKPGQIVTISDLLLKRICRITKVSSITSDEKLQNVWLLMADRERKKYNIVKTNLPKDCVLIILQRIVLHYSGEYDPLCSMRGTELY